VEVVSHDPGARPAFYYDLASPLAYLAAERVIQVLPVAAEWIPVLARDLPAGESFEAFRCTADVDAFRDGVERAAARQGLQRMVWPDPFPFDSEFAMRVATYAKQVGRAVAYSLAAFRQAFAGGRDLGVRDHVLIAASACEMHPTAVLKGAELRGVIAGLAAATELAAARGVRDVPAIWLPRQGDHGRVFHDDAGVEAAAEALGGT
jgi:2-hydroxychromene-2-carboxylate isomerase